MLLTLQKSGQIVEQLQNIVSVHTVKLPQRTVIMLKKYGNAEDFYDDNYYDFDSYEDAEDYYNDND